MTKDGSLFLTLILVLDAFLRTSSYLLRAYFVACFVCTSKSEGGQDYFASCFASRFASTSRLLRVCFVKNSSCFASASSCFASLRVSSLCRCDRNRHGLTCTILLKKLKFSPATFAFEQGGKRQLSGNYCQKPFLGPLSKRGHYPTIS